MIDDVRVEDIGKRPDQPLSPVRLEDLVPLPPPYDKFDEETEWKEIKESSRDGMVCNLDGTVASPLPRPQNEAEEQEYVDKFVAGLMKLLEPENNWTFLQPLLLSLEYCV
ncbi:MAG: (Fe-S)-binding protein, partial [Planctomycetota bacterium]